VHPLNIDIEIVKKPPDTHTFRVLRRRWVVERTFGWMNRERRLSKDYERLPATTAAFIDITMVRLMARRLARQSREPFTVVVTVLSQQPPLKSLPTKQPRPRLLPPERPLLALPPGEHTLPALLPARFDGLNPTICC
jgi:hypothetical protein